jgi:hypothetical protein
MAKDEVCGWDWVCVKKGIPKNGEAFSRGYIISSLTVLFEEERESKYFHIFFYFLFKSQNNKITLKKKPDNKSVNKSHSFLVIVK